jgi:ribosomal protein S20
LPSGKARSDKAQVSRIRNFQRQAQEALSSGDVEGAMTLGTKAKLLLDDFEK